MRNGTWVKTVETEGAARLHVKIIKEMAANRAEAKANASATDKGKMTKVS